MWAVRVRVLREELWALRARRDARVHIRGCDLLTEQIEDDTLSSGSSNCLRTPNRRRAAWDFSSVLFFLGGGRGK